MQTSKVAKNGAVSNTPENSAQELIEEKKVYIPRENQLVSGVEQDTHINRFGLTLGNIVNHQGVTIQAVDLTDERRSFKDDTGHEVIPRRLYTYLLLESVELIEDEAMLPPNIAQALKEERDRRGWN